MAFGGGLRGLMTSKNRLDSAFGALWRLTVGFGTNLKIMVSPVRIRVPPLRKHLQIEGKSKAPVMWPEPFYCNRLLTECLSIAPAAESPKPGRT